MVVDIPEWFKNVIIFVVTKVRIQHDYKQEERTSFIATLPKYNLILLYMQA
jgi:hypothetical protein